VLAAAPPHKGVADLASPEDRLRMVELALDGAPGLLACAMEIQRGGTSYSIDTIREILSRPDAPEHLVLVVGVDTFRDLRTWREHGAIFEHCDVVVLPRPGYRSTLTSHDFPLRRSSAFATIHYVTVFVTTRGIPFPCSRFLPSTSQPRTSGAA